MKIIFHACIDGYISELQFEDNCSRIFTTMDACFEYASLFTGDVEQIPQELLEYSDYKEEIVKKILQEREVEK